MTDEIRTELEKLLSDCGVDAEHVHRDFLYAVAIHFANWQRELMMKDAIDGMILKNKLFPGNVAGNLPEGNTFKQKDKVKLIIVTEE